MLYQFSIKNSQTWLGR